MINTDQKIGPFTIAFANLGRNKDRAAVIEAMRMIKKELINTETPWVLNLVEMDEGDKGYRDHTLLTLIFPKTSKIGMAFKNVVLVGGGATVTHRFSRQGSKGVTNWSPARRIIGGRIQLPDGGQIEDYSMHLPAGAHNGDRPVLAKKLLVIAYDLVNNRFKRVLSNGVRRGACQVYGIDANNKDYELNDVLEKNLIGGGPDYLRGLPSRDMKCVVHKTWSMETGIEEHHDALFATISFVPR